MELCGFRCKDIESPYSLSIPIFLGARNISSMYTRTISSLENSFCTGMLQAVLRLNLLKPIIRLSLPNEPYLGPWVPLFDGGLILAEMELAQMEVPRFASILYPSLLALCLERGGLSGPILRGLAPFLEDLSQYRADTSLDFSGEVSQGSSSYFLDWES